jgi:hypothetical protein
VGAATAPSTCLYESIYTLSAPVVVHRQLVLACVCHTVPDGYDFVLGITVAVATAREQYVAGGKVGVLFVVAA